MPEPIDPLENYNEPSIFTIHTLGGEEFEIDEGSDEIKDKNTRSFICLLEPEISRSSIFLDTYYYFPEIENPEFEFALWGPEPYVEYDNLGIVKYKELCKKEGIAPFRIVLRSLNRDKLDLRYYGLTEPEAKSIFSVLGPNLHITTLLLEDNYLSPESLRCLVEALRDNNLITILNLKHCNIGVNGAEVIGDAFMYNSAIQELDLSFNSLGNAGFVFIADGIRFNTSITKLNLSHNELGADACFAFRSVMEDNFKITELDLSWNFLYRPKAMRELAEGLSQNSYLKTLNISWNGLGKIETARALFKFLTSDLGIKVSYLDLSNNRFTAESLKLIYAGLRKNRSVRILKIRNNPFRSYELEDFSKLLLYPRAALREIDYGDIWVKKTFIPIMTKIENMNRTVKIGGIFSNFQIVGPDMQEVLLKRCKFLGMKPKKKKLRKDYGQWLLGCPEETIDADKWKNYVKTSKIKLDPNIVKLMAERFSKNNILNLNHMKEVYMRLYPDTKPPIKRKRKGKAKEIGQKGKKGKKK